MSRNLTLPFLCHGTKSIKAIEIYLWKVNVLRYKIPSQSSVCCPAVVGYFHFGKHFFKDSEKIHLLILNLTFDFTEAQFSLK